MFLVGFAVGLTGAMPPGPMLFATIGSSLKKGWSAGPRVVFGHAVLEVFVCILIVIGMSAIVDDSVIKSISLIGGLSLCMFGGLILKERNNTTLDRDLGAVITHPALAGILTSASNPYFWIWWFSAGMGLIVEGLKTGIMAAGVFMLGHWAADGIWYSFISSSFSRGRTLMSPHAYRAILSACGLFLMVFGIAFVITQM